MGQILLTDVRKKFLDYFKKNNHKTLAVIDADKFVKLCQELNLSK